MGTARDGLSQCLYRSRARPDLKTEDVRAILEASRRNNPAQGISGLLVLREGYFLQLLEGPEGAIQSLIGKIASDPRHFQFEILVQQPATERLFPSWAMGYLDSRKPKGGLSVEALNRLHDQAIRYSQPGDVKTLRSVIDTFKAGSVDLSSEFPE